MWFIYFIWFTLFIFWYYCNNAIGCNIVNLTPRNKLQWNLNQDPKFFLPGKCNWKCWLLKSNCLVYVSKWLAMGIDLTVKYDMWIHSLCSSMNWMVSVLESISSNRSWWKLCLTRGCSNGNAHDDVIKREHFPCYWPFVRGIHRSPVNSPHKGQWRGALMFSVMCASINGWVNNHEAGDLRCHCAHCDVTVMH